MPLKRTVGFQPLLISLCFPAAVRWTYFLSGYTDSPKAQKQWNQPIMNWTLHSSEPKKTFPLFQLIILGIFNSSNKLTNAFMHNIIHYIRYRFALNEIKMFFGKTFLHVLHECIQQILYWNRKETGSLSIDSPLKTCIFWIC
jgi:hypothetical protein